MEGIDALLFSREFLRKLDQEAGDDAGLVREIIATSGSDLAELPFHLRIPEVLPGHPGRPGQEPDG
jgi:hypothetical protein